MWLLPEAPLRMTWLLGSLNDCLDMMFMGFRVRPLSCYDAKIGKRYVALAKFICMKNIWGEKWKAHLCIIKII